MSEPDKDPLLLDHEIDGIQEFDNDLPRWWLWLFYLSTVFAVVYLIVLHGCGLGSLSHEKYEGEMARAARLAEMRAIREAATTPPLPTEPTLEADTVAFGQKLFLTHCVVCHREQGQGLVGPNLTDNHWLHGPAFADNQTIIIHGVPAKGMIAWKNVLRPPEIHAVASYIYTLRGTNPPEPKPPEGTFYEPEAPAEDAVPEPTPEETSDST